jgi:EpsI family protein
MNKRQISSFAIGALMLLSALASYALTPTAKLSQQHESIDLEAAVPKHFGQWTLDPNAMPIAPSAEKEELINRIYDQTLNRTYVNPAGERIMLSIAYGGSQTGQLRAHRQEVCYAAQGFAVSDLHAFVLGLGGAEVRGTRMVARQGTQRIEPVTYWFTIGDEVVRSYLDRQLVQLKYAFSGFIPDGYLYRVSSISADSQQAFDKQDAFTRELLTQVDPRLLKRLVGNGERP